MIPIDSVFSPGPAGHLRGRAHPGGSVHRLRPASSSRSTTDGSITPREALASAGGTLRALVQLVEEMSDEPQGLELTDVAPGHRPARPISSCPSRTSTSPNVPAIA